VKTEIDLVGCDINNVLSSSCFSLHEDPAFRHSSITYKHFGSLFKFLRDFDQFLKCCGSDSTDLANPLASLAVDIESECSGTSRSHQE